MKVKSNSLSLCLTVSSLLALLFIFVISLKNSSTQVEQIYMRVSNTDDIADAYLNGKLVLRVTRGNDSNWVNITENCSQGENNLRFVLTNVFGTWSYHFQVKVGEKIVFDEECGVLNGQGCMNNDTQSGVRFEKTYTFIHSGKQDNSPPATISVTDSTYYRSISFSPDGTHMALGGLNGRVINLTNGKTEWFDDKILLMLFSLKGNYLIYARENVITVMDAQNFAVVNQFKMDNAKKITKLAFNSDGGILAVASADLYQDFGQKTTLFSVPGLQFLFSFDGSVRSLTFNPKEPKLYIGSEWQKHTITEFDMTTGQSNVVLTGFEGDVYDLAISNDGKYLAAALSHGMGGNPKLVKVWDLSSKYKVNVCTIGAFDRDALGIHFRPDKSYELAAIGISNKLFIYEIPSGREIRNLVQKPSPYDNDTNQVVAYHPSGKFMVASNAGLLSFWDADSGKLILDMYFHAYSNANIFFNPLQRFDHQGDIDKYKSNIFWKNGQNNLPFDQYYSQMRYPELWQDTFKQYFPEWYPPEAPPSITKYKMRVKEDRVVIGFLITKRVDEAALWNSESQILEVKLPGTTFDPSIAGIVSNYNSQLVPPLKTVEIKSQGPEAGAPDAKLIIFFSQPSPYTVKHEPSDQGDVIVITINRTSRGNVQPPPSVPRESGTPISSDNTNSISKIQSEAKANLGAIFVVSISFFAEHQKWGRTFKEVGWIPSPPNSYAYFLNSCKEVIPAFNGFKMCPAQVSKYFETHPLTQKAGFHAAAVYKYQMNGRAYFDIWVIDQRKTLEQLR